MDDVDFVLGQYDKGKGMSKKRLIFYSSYHRLNTFLLPCQTANYIRDLQLDIMSTTFLGRERSKMLRCILFCSGQTRCRMILLGSEESKQPVSVNENVSGSQLKTGRSSTRPVERTHGVPSFLQDQKHDIHCNMQSKAHNLAVDLALYQIDVEQVLGTVVDGRI